MDALHIVVAGAGGNIGSHLLPHLARMPRVSRLTLVDPDVYEAANAAVQAIDACDAGEGKAAAQAAKLRRIRADLEVTALAERIEDVPRGLVRCDLFVSCLDSKLARIHLNELAWRLNTGWIDGGVLGSQSLVRVSGYAPANDAPCLECSWNPGRDGEYSHLEQEYLCCATRGAAFPSMSSSALGALAASLLAFEIAKFARDGVPGRMASRQVIFDVEHRVVQETGERRNPWCRFDHRIWEISPWHCRLARTTIREAIDALGSLQVDGHRFVTELVCPGCARRRNQPRLNRPLARCPHCNRRMATAGFGGLERLDSRLAGEFLPMTLADCGLRTGDIVSSGRRHWQLVEEP